MQHRFSPAEGLERLIEGNRRFSEGRSAHRYAREARQHVLDGQRPFATVFGCSDSRVPVELIFDQGLGDIFVIRNAGHIVGESVFGSMEFAVSYIGCPLIVILGHSHCGAVTAAVKAWNNQERPTGYMTSIVRSIQPVVTIANTTDIDEVMRAHVIDSMRTIHEASVIIANETQRGNLWLVAAEYDLETQRINVLRSIPDWDH